MYLPNLDHAYVPPAKIVDYLLSDSHEDGGPKAYFFKLFGFDVDQWRVLADALIEHANSHEVVRVSYSPFGVRYVIEGQLSTPSGRRPEVRSVWFIDDGGDSPRLISAYPL